MSSDVTLFIVEPAAGVVVCARWIGMRGTLERVHQILARPADHADPELGYEYWGRVTSRQVTAISEAAYAGGADPDEVAAYAKEFPDDAYWWMIGRDY